MNGQEKLTELLKEVVDPKLKDQANEILEQVKSENNTLAERINALESMPANKVNFKQEEEPISNIKYKGRKISDLGKKLKISDKLREPMAKMFIDFIESAMKYGKAAMNEGTVGEGGYLVFDEYVQELMAFARLQSIALQKARIINVSTDSVHIPTESSSISVAWLNEVASITESEPTVSELNLTPKKLAAYSIASNELLADSAFDIVSWLTDLYAEAIGQEFDNQMFNGSTWTGIVSAAGIGTVETTGNSISDVSIDFLAQVLTSMAPNKAAGSEFYFHRNGFRYILALEDGAGNSVWSPSLTNQAGSIWGVPVNLPEQFPSAVYGAAVFGLYGNLNHYIIAMRKGNVSLDIDPYGAFLTDQTRFRGIVRAHGAPWNTGAFVQLKV